MLIKADEALDAVTVDGKVNVDGFRAMLAPLVKPGARTRISSPRATAFALLRGYSMGHFYKDAAHQEICGLHTHVSSDPAADSAKVH